METYLSVWVLGACFVLENLKMHSDGALSRWINNDISAVNLRNRRILRFMEANHCVNSAKFTFLNSFLKSVSANRATNWPLTGRPSSYAAEQQSSCLEKLFCFENAVIFERDVWFGFSSLLKIHFNFRWTFSAFCCGFCPWRVYAHCNVTEQAFSFIAGNTGVADPAIIYFFWTNWLKPLFMLLFPLVHFHAMGIKSVCCEKRRPALHYIQVWLMLVKLRAKQTCF